MFPEYINKYWYGIICLVIVILMLTSDWNICDNIRDVYNTYVRVIYTFLITCDPVIYFNVGIPSVTVIILRSMNYFSCFLYFFWSRIYKRVV